MSLKSPKFKGWSYEVKRNEQEVIERGEGGFCLGPQSEGVRLD